MHIKLHMHMLARSLDSVGMHRHGTDTRRYSVQIDVQPSEAAVAASANASYHGTLTYGTFTFTDPHTSRVETGNVGNAWPCVCLSLSP